MIKKNDKEIFVTFNVKKNGRYYAKEELKLKEFENMLECFIPSRITTKYNIWQRIIGLPKKHKMHDEMIEELFKNYKFFLIEHIKETMEYDGPGKRVLKL
jgi:hypothetical protein